MSVQLRGPDCGHGYTAYNGRHPDGSECGYAVARAFGLYHGSDDAVPAGRTYGSDAGGPLSRLASKVKCLPARTKVWAGLFLAVFAVLFIVLCARAVWLNVDPPAYEPLPTPTVSPGSNGFYFGMRAP